jgi:hypothetical protein
MPLGTHTARRQRSKRVLSSFSPHRFQRPDAHLDDAHHRDHRPIHRPLALKIPQDVRQRHRVGMVGFRPRDGVTFPVAGDRQRVDRIHLAADGTQAGDQQTKPEPNPGRFKRTAGEVVRGHRDAASEPRRRPRSATPLPRQQHADHRDGRAEPGRQEEDVAGGQGGGREGKVAQPSLLPLIRGCSTSPNGPATPTPTSMPWSGSIRRSATLGAVDHWRAPI